MHAISQVDRKSEGSETMSDDEGGQLSPEVIPAKAPEPLSQLETQHQFPTFSQLSDLSQLLPTFTSSMKNSKVIKGNIKKVSSFPTSNKKMAFLESSQASGSMTTKPINKKAETFRALDNALSKLPQVAPTVNSLSHMSIADFRVLLAYHSEQPKARQQSNGASYSFLNQKLDKREQMEQVYNLFIAGQFNNALQDLRRRLSTIEQLPTSAGVTPESAANTHTIAIAPNLASTKQHALDFATGDSCSTLPLAQSFCICGSEDDWINVDVDTQQALERGDRAYRLLEVPQDPDESEHESEEGASEVLAKGTSDGVFFSPFQAKDWTPVSQEVQRLLEFDNTSFAQMEVLSRQQSGRLFGLLQADARVEDSSNIGKQVHAQLVKDELPAPISLKVQDRNSKDVSACNDENAGLCTASPLSMPTEMPRVSASEVQSSDLTDYSQLLHNYFYNYLNANSLSPCSISQTHCSAALSEASQSASTEAKSSPQSPLARVGTGALLIPCEDSSTQTEPMSTGRHGLLQCVDPVQLPANAVKLLRFTNPKLGLVLGSVVRHCGTNRTVVRAKIEHLDIELSRLIQVGDELVSISGCDVETLTYDEQVKAISGSARPIVLGFVPSTA